MAFGTAGFAAATRRINTWWILCFDEPMLVAATADSTHLQVRHSLNASLMASLGIELRAIV